MAQLKDTTITGGLSVSGTTNLTSGGQSNANITLYAASGDSPALIFQRGTTSDTLNDYKIYDTGGYLKVKQSGNSGTTGYTQVAELTNAGKLTVSTPPATDTTPSTSAWISPTDSGIKISGTAVTPASGDYIIVSDSSASNVASRGIAIGTSTSTYLRNDGTWATPSGGGGGGVTPSDIVVKGYDYTGETTLYSGNLGSGLAVIEPLILDDAAVPELAIEHKNSGVTAGTYYPQYNDKDGNYYLPSFTTDSAGHITDASTATYYLEQNGTYLSGSPKLFNSWDYAGLVRAVNVHEPHLLSPLDKESSGAVYSFYPSSYASAGYYSVTIGFSATPSSGGFLSSSTVYYNSGNSTVTISGYQIVDVIFTQQVTKVPITGGTSTSGSIPVDFDWFCTNFSYNSSTSRYEATLYIYIDSGESTDKNQVYFWPVVKGYAQISK